MSLAALPVCRNRVEHETRRLRGRHAGAVETPAGEHRTVSDLDSGDAGCLQGIAPAPMSMRIVLSVTSFTASASKLSTAKVTV